jgi:hypothetical protein
MMRQVSVVVLLMFFPICGISQQDSLERSPRDIFRHIELKSHQKIQFEQDSGIHNLVLKHIAKSKVKPGIEGYRIRIYADLGTHAREESEEVRAEFHENFPEIPVYRDYDDNWWKVYVGDFRTKVQAVKTLKKIRRVFRYAFVVEHQINFPELN